MFTSTQAWSDDQPSIICRPDDRMLGVRRNIRTVRPLSLVPNLRAKIGIQEALSLRCQTI